jgi:uncharacterized lipoprotein YmbA
MRLLGHAAICRATLIAAAAFALNCLGSSPDVSLYTMSSVSSSSTAAATDGPAIGVGPIRVPRYLDRPDWVTRPDQSTSRLEIDGARRWAGGFSANVLSVLAENLGAKLGTQRVVVYPVQAPFPLDYRIAVDFQAFEGIGGEALELRANWVIRAGSGEGGPWSGQSTMRRPIAGSGPDALVAAHNEALDLLADAIASRIESLPASEPSGDGSDGSPSD